MERTARAHSAVVPDQTPARQNSAFENGMILGLYCIISLSSVCEIDSSDLLAGILSRKLSSASSLGSMEESYYLQASLDSSDSLSERRTAGEATMSPYYMKSMTPGAFEAALRQKEGELASYMSRLVSFSLACNNFGTTYFHIECCRIFHF